MRYHISTILLLLASLIFRVRGQVLDYGRNLTSTTSVEHWQEASSQSLATRRLGFNEGVVTKLNAGTEYVFFATWSPDGTKLASASEKKIFIWDMESSPPKRNINIKGPEERVRCASWSPDGTKLAVGSEDNTVRIWDINNNTYAEVFNWAGSTDVYTVRYSPDGSRLATGSRDGTIRIWNMTNNDFSLVNEISNKKGGEVNAVAFSPDGSKVASGWVFDSIIRVWDMQTKELKNLEGHSEEVLSVSYSPDNNKTGGYTMASGSSDKSIRIWNMTSNSLVKKFTTDAKVYSVMYSPDGTKLVSTVGNQIVIYDIETEKIVESLEKHTDTVLDASYSEDGSRLASGSFDKTIRIWEYLTQAPTTLPSMTPSMGPSLIPSALPSISLLPSKGPSLLPTYQPSLPPSRPPSTMPSMFPSLTSSALPSVSLLPSQEPSLSPSNEPSVQPSKLCGEGNYLNNENTNNAECTPCGKGTFQGKVNQDSCDLCLAGTYQNITGGVVCTTCEAGSFQPRKGGTKCDECRAGGYCNTTAASDECGGGFIPCPIGTYNSNKGQANISSCLLCPPGTYHDNRTGLQSCPKCPYRLDSETNSSTCDFCAEGFYLKNKNVTSNILMNSNNTGDFCLACPANAKCPNNTSIETLEADGNGLWRKSIYTEKLYACKSDGCQRNTSCAEGFSGILCEMCDEETHYFSSQDRKCIECPPLTTAGIVSGTVIIFLVIICMKLAPSGVFSDLKHFLNKFSTFLTGISMSAKLKIVISFYQVVVTFSPIYGLQMHSAFKEWFRFLQVFNLGLAELIHIPGSCYGTMKTRLIVSGVWPFALIAILCALLLFYIICVRVSELTRKKAMVEFWYRSLYLAIITCYLVLPSVSRSIFDAITCKSFTDNDAKDLSTSHLIADWSLECDVVTDPRYKVVQSIFWAFFVIWPIGIPMLFLYLLLSIRKSVQSKQTTPLAEACYFLWNEYHETSMLWELIDIARKICLTGLVIFIDTEEGSGKISRLIIAIIICSFYTCILSVARPYRRNDDFYLAIISNQLLTCCFVVGIVIHQCKEDEDGTCEELFGRYFNSYRATSAAVILTASMLAATVLFIFYLAYNAIQAPTIRLVSTNTAPHLSIPKDCTHHLFLSHVWDTGQDKAHKIVRMIQLYLPGVKIWLDVDSLENVAMLENSVSEAVHFVLFYSKGYFKSKNCRREVEHAVENSKSITVIYESNDDVYDEVYEMKEECKKFWSAGSYDDAIKCIFAKDPIMWLNESRLFSLESLKLVVGRLLAKLPYYEDNYALLEAGLKIGCESSPVKVLSPLQITYCSANIGAYDVALSLAEECKGEVSVCDISVSSSQARPNDEKTVMLLYLFDGVFDDGPGDLLQEILERAIKDGTQVILVHEKDTNKCGCPFDNIISQTPPELMKVPYNLYNGLAISLYPAEYYRQVSLRQILSKMGATPIGKSSSHYLNWSLLSMNGTPIRDKCNYMLDCYAHLRF